MTKSAIISIREFIMFEKNTFLGNVSFTEIELLNFER